MNEKMDSELMALIEEYKPHVFGIGDFSQYDRELVGLPDYIRKEYTFIVSFGLVLSKSVLDTVTDGPNLIYLHHYRQLNYRLDMIGYHIALAIERKGYKALPFPASQIVDWQHQRGHISHKRAGEISGIGWIGRNNLLIHPVYGARVRYNTVLTNMPLVPGTPLSFSCGKCRACMDVCPAGAIKEDPLSFDHHGCYEMLDKFKKKRNLGHHICGICIKACRGSR